MKHYKTEMREYRRETGVTCDVCGGHVGYSNYDVQEASVSMRQGNVYPEGDFTTKEEYDLCVPCYRSIVDAALKAKGARPAIIDNL